MKDDNTWLWIMLAAGVALYLMWASRNKAPASVAYAPSFPAMANPLAATNVNPALAPATQNVVASVSAAAHSSGASGVSSSPFSLGPSAAVVAPDIWSADASDPSASTGHRYQPGPGPALIL